MTSGTARLQPIRFLALATAALLLSGCGGGSEPSAEPAETAASTIATPEEPEGITAERLAEALPADDWFPEGSSVSVRCPGDPPCTADERQDQDASISVDLPLPDGVQPNGTGRDQHIVEGGEYSENIWLRAWLYDDAATAEGYLTSSREGLEELTGTIDTPPVETDSGYEYGIQGKGSVKELRIGEWKGFARILDAVFIHLDGRVGDPRYDVFAVMQKDGVYVRVDSSFTVQGRDQADAEGAVEGLLTEYLEGL